MKFSFFFENRTNQQILLEFKYKKNSVIGCDYILKALYLIKVTHKARFELAVSGFVDRRLIQLGHKCSTIIKTKNFIKFLY